ncbi:hypothetical protein [uncultured Mycolicibacterium sp.]|uniref:hypothetical protein n=1 Tax=uncultured Mycolicibacterium sp. TaxID=2320817 RepID=UPI002622943A|nr:hypothetical protein [uncultured Mycolicibacterium sp.]
MKKLVVFGVGALAAGSAALMGAGVATSQPADLSSLNVIGEPYNRALMILKSQGVKAVFGGSFGNAVPQAQCLVDKQKINSSGKMVLMLDCTKEAQEQLVDDGGPTVGANGITTVTPTPVVPIQGAPGAGTPPPA